MENHTRILGSYGVNLIDFRILINSDNLSESVLNIIENIVSELNYTSYSLINLDIPGYCNDGKIKIFNLSSDLKEHERRHKVFHKIEKGKLGESFLSFNESNAMAYSDYVSNQSYFSKLRAGISSDIYSVYNEIFSNSSEFNDTNSHELEGITKKYVNAVIKKSGIGHYYNLPMFLIVAEYLQYYDLCYQTYEKFSEKGKKIINSGVKLMVESNSIYSGLDYLTKQFDANEKPIMFDPLKINVTDLFSEENNILSIQDKRVNTEVSIHTTNPFIIKTVGKTLYNHSKLGKYPDSFSEKFTLGKSLIDFFKENNEFCSYLNI